MDGIGQETTAQLNTVITWILAVMLIVALAGVGYVSMTPRVEEDPYTEFYILGPGGEATDYPTNLTTGETSEFIVGITNNEHEDLTYTVVLGLDGEMIEEQSVILEDRRTWEEEFVFRVEEPGKRQLDILLFVGDEAGSLNDPYQELRLVIEVRE